MKINILIKKKYLQFWQFKVKIFGEILQICHVQHSFSNTGDPYDNAVIESFFSTFKKEAINRKEFEDIVSLKRAIDNYNNYHNLYRPHRTLNNQNPENFGILYLSELKKKSK